MIARVVLVRGFPRLLAQGAGVGREAFQGEGGDGKIKAPPSPGAQMVVKIAEFAPSPAPACRRVR